MTRTDKQQYKRAHHRQYSSPSDLGCNISTGNTRSSDVLDLPLSGVTLVIVSSAFPVAAVAATRSLIVIFLARQQISAVVGP
ncbi:unnamed protein product [Aureobasidium pullulans]|nr:unnamed protein product [Aureobasidium pullulans]